MATQSSNASATAGALAFSKPGAIADPSSCAWTVGMLESVLSEAFPADLAEVWDRQGIVCGDASAVVSGVAVALDPTPAAVDAACASGANVLVTHHPPFIEPPQCFRPPEQGFCDAGSVVYHAIRSGVNLLNYHTSLDVSTRAARVLPGMLSLSFIEAVDLVDADRGLGYGQRCAVRSEDAPLTLQTLAARCVAVFGRMPRMWGSPSARLEIVVTCTGSAGNLPEACLELGADCLVCGEVKYHAALPASQAGLCIIELGHDVSELPLAAALAQAIEEAGFPAKGIKLVDQSGNWATPEAIRR